MGKLAMTAEDHLKTIYTLHLEDGRATPSAVAAKLGISAPSVSEAVKRLRRDGFVAPAGGAGLELTEAGQRRALEVVRRHRVVETFLHRVLGFALHELHVEADLLEHAITGRVLDRLDALLDHPERDPHGDPIPREGQPHDETWPPSLAAAPEGSSFAVERVADHDDAALERLVAEGIVPGVELEVGAPDPFGGGLDVRLGGRALRLAPGLVEAVHGTARTPQASA